jgi:hypothetical protein
MIQDQIEQLKIATLAVVRDAEQSEATATKRERQLASGLIVCARTNLQLLELLVEQLNQRDDLDTY